MNLQANYGGSDETLTESTETTTKGRRRAPATGDPLAMTVRQAAAFLGVPVKLVRRELHLGRLAAKVAGPRSTLISREAALAWFRSLPDAAAS